MLNYIILSKILKRLKLVVLGGVLITNWAMADIVNNNAFLKGQGIELGIGSDGAFGSDIVAPDGFYKGKYLGFISDEKLDGFENGYDGDFFFPGSPEEGWGISIDGTTYNNNNNIQSPQIRGMDSNSGQFSDFINEESYYQSVKWTGRVEDIKVEKTYQIYHTGSLVSADIKLTNLSQNDINNVYYIRTLDPDNNYSNIYNATGTYETTNVILKQGNTHSYSLISASQNDGSSISLLGLSKDSKVAIGGYLVRDPLLVYGSGQGMLYSGTRTADEPISLVFKLGTIKAGSHSSFRYAYNLSPMDIFLLETSESSYYNKRQYFMGKSAIDIFPVISPNKDSNYIIKELIVDIKSPREKDKLLAPADLPEGLSIDTKRTKDDYLIIRGESTIEDYLSVLRKVKFINNIKDLSSKDISLDARKVTAFLLNKQFSPSNPLESTINVTLPITVDIPIMEDNKVNLDEANYFKLKGWSAPLATINVQLLDENNNKLEVITDAANNGQWELTLAKNEVLSLVDGPISALFEATDVNDVKTNVSHSFLKDTKVLDLIFDPNKDPLRDQYISQAELSPFEMKGSSEANLTLTVEIRDDVGKIITLDTTSDENGNWVISSNEVASLADGMLQFKILKEDALGNKGEELYQAKKDLSTSITLNKGDIANDIINFDNQKKLLLSGEGEPGAEIEVIFTDSSGAVVIAKTMVDDDGQWTFLPNKMDVTSLLDGSIRLVINAKDTAGNEQIINYPNALVKDTKVGSTAIVSPGANGLVNFEEPEIKGTSEPDSTIILTTNNKVLCTTKSDASSNWSCLLPSMTMDESSNIIITVRDKYNNVEEIPLYIVAGKYEDVQIVKTILKGSGSISIYFLLILGLIMLQATLLQTEKK